MQNKLLFEASVAGSNSFQLPPLDVPEETSLPTEMLRSDNPPLPDLPENETVRHFTRLSKRAYGVDDGFYLSLIHIWPTAGAKKQKSKEEVR